MFSIEERCLLFLTNPGDNWTLVPRTVRIIDFRNPYIWDDLNESVKQTLGITAPVRVYQSVNHALLELGMAFSVLYSMKRQYLATLPGLGTHADDMTVFLSRQGIRGTPQDLTASTEALDDKKILFWILDRDDAITGQKYVNDGRLKEDSKIFRIFVSHSLHLSQWPDSNMAETDIYVLSHPPTGGAIAVFGRRTQNIQSALCPTLSWEAFKNIAQFPKHTEDAVWVKSIEGKSVLGSAPLLVNVSERIYDRAIIYWKDKSSSSIRELLIKEHNVSPLDIDCLSLTQWLDTRLLPQFATRGWDANTYRGTLILSSRLAQDSSFEQKLVQALERLDKLSKLSGTP